MAGRWRGSDRRERLPANWPELVAMVKKRAAGRCEFRLPDSKTRCPRDGRDVDHIANDDNHNIDNLRLACPAHHGKKSSAEGAAAKAALKASRTRPEERHPGERR